MIVYFADRKLNILGQASTKLPNGILILDDGKDEDVDSGVAIFECELGYDAKTRAKVEACVEAGNYILRKHDEENEFYTIIDSEINTKNQTARVYAEDAGLDLLNEIVGAYEADQAYPISHYIEKFAYDSGFVIGINEAASLTRQLKWDGEETVTARLASVATQFDGCEISFSYDIKGLRIVAKKINIYKQRGKDIGTTMHLNKEIDNIVIKKTIANVATALRCSGGTPDKSSDVLEEALSDAGSPKVSYSVTLETLNRNANTVNIGATIQASLDSEEASLGKGYVLTASIYMGGSWHNVTIKPTDDEWKGTTNHTTEFTFTVSGLSAAAITFTDIKFKVSRSDSLGGSVGVLSAKACGSHTVSNYISGGENGENIANRPMTLEGYVYDDGDFYIDGDTLKCRSALQKWSRYINPTEQNLTEGQEGHIFRPYSFDTISQATLCAHSITELKKLIDTEVNYEADILYLPANTKIGDRVNIVDEAGELFLSTRLLQLKTSVVNQEQKATLGEFIIKNGGISEKVEALANQFAAEAAANRKAKEEAAKKAAEAAAKAEAARKEAEEAARKAAEAERQLEEARLAAEEAQRLADEAKAQAEAAAQAAAQAKADAADASAQTAITKQSAEAALQKAEDAQSTANTAKTEADDAKTTAMAAKLDAEQALQDIVNLGENLETVQNTMQADYARKTELTETEASLQSQISQNASEIASTVSLVATIDETVNDAKEQAETAQATASEAQAKADQAKTDAEAAITAAGNATQAATNAQAQADIAHEAAEAAQQAAEEAESKASRAETDLETAKQNLANVTSRVDATEEEVEEAKAAVVTAQAAADQAKANAKTAQDSADQAKADAENAQTLANNAKTAADNAQAAAEEAQQAADEALDAANALAVRVSTAETKIQQNAEQIALMATKEEVAQNLGGYYTKTETDAAIKVKADEINLSVDSKIDSVQVGGRNLLLNSNTNIVDSTDHNIATLYFGDSKPIEGEIYTITLKGVLGSGKRCFDTYNSGEYVQFGELHEEGNGIYSYTGEWKVTYAADTSKSADNSCLFIFSMPSSVGSASSIEWVKLEKGNKATDWSPAPEDMASASDIAAVTSEIASVTESISALDIKADNISASVTEIKTSTESAIDSVNSNIETLTNEVSAKMNAEAVEIEIQKAMENGTSKVVTSTGFTFDDEGMTVQKSGSEMKTQITEDGMTVYQNDEATLTANNKGVDARNLHATTYLIVGGRSRFENYGNDRTGCFWIGG